MSSKTYFGVDVSKETLDFHGPAAQGSLANTSQGQRRLLARLPKNAHLVCEASGGYERSLVAAAQKAGVAISVVNPRQVRDFTRGLGRLAKTDPIDAAMLARFGEQVTPRANSIPIPARLALAELVTARQQLAEERTLVLQQAAQQTLALTRSLARAHDSNSWRPK